MAKQGGRLVEVAAASTIPRRDERLGDRLLLAAVVFGLGFQFVHVLEHVIQVLYWAWHPAEAPWFTPWAAAGRDALADAASGSPAEGGELLHLFGNLIFLGGLLALIALVGRRRGPQPTGLRSSTWIQGLHVGEHLALTATAMWAGRSIGVTTGFGQLEGAAAGGVRVWTHFLLNMVATGLAAVAVLGWLRANRQAVVAAVSPPAQERSAPG